MQNPFLACPRRLKARENFPCKWGLHVTPSIFLVKGDLRFLAPKPQWFPQPFEFGTVGSLTGKQHLISLERPNFPAKITFFSPILLLSVLKGKTKRGSYLENLKLECFYCLQLSPDKDTNVKTGKNLWQIHRDFQSKCLKCNPRFLLRVWFWEVWSKRFISLSNTSLKWKSLMDSSEIRLTVMLKLWLTLSVWGRTVYVVIVKK